MSHVKIEEHLSVTKLSRESLCEIVPAVTGGLLVITSQCYTVVGPSPHKRKGHDKWCDDGDNIGHNRNLWPQGGQVGAGGNILVKCPSFSTKSIETLLHFLKQIFFIFNFFDKLSYFFLFPFVKFLRILSHDFSFQVTIMLHNLNQLQENNCSQCSHCSQEGEMVF